MSALRKCNIIKVNLQLPYNGGELGYFEYKGNIFEILGISNRIDLIPLDASPMAVHRQYIARNQYGRYAEVYVYIKTRFDGTTSLMVDSISFN